MLFIKVYCAGILVLEQEVEEKALKSKLKKIKSDLSSGVYTITFGIGITQIASEVCVDVYEKETMKYRQDLSVAFKK